MMDLLYIGDSKNDSLAAQKLILEKFPSAKVEEDWDFIHEYRIAINIDEEHRREYIKFAIREFAPISFFLQLGLMSGDEATEEIKSIVDEMKAEREAKKAEEPK